MTISSLTVAQLYERLDVVRDAYATTPWDGVEALQTEHAAILAEINHRERTADLRRCEAAGLPTSFAYPRS